MYCGLMMGEGWCLGGACQQHATGSAVVAGAHLGNGCPLAVVGRPQLPQPLSSLHKGCPDLCLGHGVGATKQRGPRSKPSGN